MCSLQVRAGNNFPFPFALGRCSCVLHRLRPGTLKYMIREVQAYLADLI